MKQNRLINNLLDIVSFLSIVGIWPRFIEPNLLKTSRISISLPSLPHEFVGMKILHFSDLHFSHRLSDRFLLRLFNRVQTLSPDLILFTGDFLCLAELEEGERLAHFLKKFSAPLGCFAILGNHDYQSQIKIDKLGNYVPEESAVLQMIKETLFFWQRAPLTGKFQAVIPPNDALVRLLAATPFKLLHNESVQIVKQTAKINLVGLGDLMAGQCDPRQAFSHCLPDYPAIALSHHPDTIPLLTNYPVDLILSGHTHGAQINLPWIRTICTPMRYPKFRRGLKQHKGKFAYINRGIGGSVSLRLFSLPELSLITLSS